MASTMITSQRSRNSTCSSKHRNSNTLQPKSSFEVTPPTLNTSFNTLRTDLEAMHQQLGYIEILWSSIEYLDADGFIIPLPVEYNRLLTNIEILSNTVHINQYLLLPKGQEQEVRRRALVENSKMVNALRGSVKDFVRYMRTDPFVKDCARKEEILLSPVVVTEH